MPPLPMWFTRAGAYPGSVAVARHRAQAVADLARWRRPRAYRMAAPAPARGQRPWRRRRGWRCRCAVRDLDVVVTVEVPVAFAGVARAGARGRRPADTQ
ncbi:hypothetical protein I545_6851 [Mycobacterium kansasii 662]|uniref:Uncharacterized protein n=1 Tax=Mycobacterium kansasii 662 TaxID=1299326 RepID=X7XSB6_MYCKA|nr:hypothetical protein I545_6851 [Mycobacterium kansasii 662]